MTSRAAGAAVLALLAVHACGGEDAAGPSEASGTLRAAAVSMNSVRLSWPRSEESNVALYRVARREGLSGEFAGIVDLPAATPGDSIIHFDNGVEPEKVYGYRVSTVDREGKITSTSLVAGVRTPERPGIEVTVTTHAPGATPLDPDGYRVHIVGPDTLASVIGPISGTAPVSRRYSPLKPGTYAVSLGDLAEHCRLLAAEGATAPDTLRSVNVTADGVLTIARANYDVDCRDPNRGDIVAAVSVTGGARDAGGFTLLVTGLAADATLPESERVYFRRQAIASETGGSSEFLALRPGSYEVTLEGVDAGCTLAGAPVRSAAVTALGSERIEFVVGCGEGGEEVPDPARPLKLRSRWSEASAAVGATVDLIVTLDLSAGSPLEIGNADLITVFDRAVLRYEGVTFSAPWTSLGVSEPSRANASGEIAWIAGDPTPRLQTVTELARLRFSVIAAPSAPATSTRPRSTVTGMANGAGDVLTDALAQLQPLNAALTIGGGGGGGGNVAPVPVIDGGPAISVAAGTPVTLSGASSADPDGTIATWSWSTPGGTPAQATGATVTTVYPTAGSYSATLTVTDNLGATASASKQVFVADGTRLQLGGSFDAPAADGSRTLVLVLDLGADLPQTPGAERVRSFVIDSLTWNSTVLRFEGVTFPSYYNGSYSPPPASSPGRLRLNASAVGTPPTGLVELARVRFSVPGASGATTAVVAAVGALTGTDGFDYLPLTSIANAQFTVGSP